MNTGKLMTVLLTLSTAALLFSSFAAKAVDGKAYGATHCFADSSSDQEKIVFQTPTGAVRNNSSSGYAYIVCPVVRDAGSRFSIKMRVRDRHSNRNISCTAYSVDQSGNQVGRSRRESTSGTFNYQTLNFGTIPGGAGNSIFISCRIPPAERDSYGNLWKSSILSYEVIEY